MERYSRLEKDHATGVAESVADLGYVAVSAAQMAKLETRRRVCSSEACRVSSAYVRLSIPRESATS